MDPLAAVHALYPLHITLDPNGPLGPLDLLECWLKLFKLKIVKNQELYFELESANKQ